MKFEKLLGAIDGQCKTGLDILWTIIPWVFQSFISRFWKAVLKYQMSRGRSSIKPAVRRVYLDLHLRGISYIMYWFSFISKTPILSAVQHNSTLSCSASSHQYHNLRIKILDQYSMASVFIFLALESSCSRVFSFSNTVCQVRWKINNLLKRHKIISPAKCNMNNYLKL